MELYLHLDGVDDDDEEDLWCLLPYSHLQDLHCDDNIDEKNRKGTILNSLVQKDEDDYADADEGS